MSFTLIEDKHYENNEEKEENIIDEDEIKRESEKKWEIVRWTEESCNWFDFDNISGETELCASADTDLKTNGWNIVAFAPYDNAGDLNLYFSWWIMKNNYWDADNWRESFITDFSCEWSGTQCTNTFNDFWPDATDYINNESFVSFNNNTNWVYIDKDGFEDKLKYWNVNISWNFVIEFNIKGDILYQNWTKYILDNPNNKWLAFATSSNQLSALFLNGWGASISPTISINPDHFYKIELEKISWGWNNTFVKIYNTTTENLIYNDYAEHTNLDFSTMYVWSKNDYNININWIIDSIKIYDK